MDAEGNLTAVEIFAGAGGLLLGTALAGFKHLVAVEWERNCCNTLRINQKKAYPLIDSDMQIIESDVRDVDWSFLPQNIDLLAGGPPCQPFSFGGLARGETDKRDMFPTYTGVLAKLKPRAFICENVKGLTRKSFSKYYEYILLRLQHPSFPKQQEETWEQHANRLTQLQTLQSDTLQINNKYLYPNNTDEAVRYKVIPTVVNAADYGVPQHRYRVIIVGFRSDIDVPWTFPQPTHGKGLKQWNSLGEAIKDLPKLNNEAHNGVARSYPGHTGSELGKPSKAIKAGVHGVPGGENMIRYPDSTLRYMTVREAARLQTFPDGYEFTGAWSEGMRQIGNAVPVELARIVASAIACTLREDTARKRVDLMVSSELNEMIEYETTLV